MPGGAAASAQAYRYISKKRLVYAIGAACYNPLMIWVPPLAAGSTCLRAAAFAALLLAGSSAMATPIITTSLTALPTSGFTEVDLTGVSLGSAPINLDNAAITFSVASGQGIVNGSSSGAYAAPVTASGAYTGNYFSTGTGSITFTYSSYQLALAVLWGSVDTFNTITLMNGSTVVDTITGSQITSNANGSQGYGGSFFVLINETSVFNKVVFSSTNPSFEFAEFEVDPNNYYAPEPASLAGFGSGLLALALIRRRRA